MRRLLALGSLVALSVGAFSCTAVLGIEDTTFQAGPTAGGDWTCVGSVPTETPATSSIDITVNIVDFGGSDPPATSLSVKACASKIDNVCATPVATASSDAKGVAVLSIPLSGGRGFNGYLEVTGTGYIRYLWYFSRPLTKSRAFPLNSVKTEVLDLLLSGFKATPDPTRGHLAVNTTDCQDVDAPGVKVTCDLADTTSLPFYFKDGLLSGSVTETQKGYALGGYFNVKAGTAVVRAIPNATGKAMAENSVIIAPGTLTTMRMLPN